MKRFIISAIFALYVTNSAYAQVPVIDPTAINTSIMQQAQTMMQWQQQLQGMMNQLNTLQNQYQMLQSTYDSISGSRGFGQIANNPALNDYFPQNWQQTYQSLQQTGNGLTSTAKTLYDTSKIFDRCAQLTDQQAKILCMAGSQKSAQDLDFANNALTVAAQRLQQIQTLMGKIDATSDLKGATEMTARLGAEQNNIQSADSKLKMQMFSADQNDNLLRERSRQYQAQAGNRPNSLPPVVVTFGSQ